MPELNQASQRTRTKALSVRKRKIEFPYQVPGSLTLALRGRPPLRPLARAAAVLRALFLDPSRRPRLSVVPHLGHFTGDLVGRLRFIAGEKNPTDGLLSRRFAR